MLITPQALQEKIIEIQQVFVLVKLNQNNSVYFNITKMAIKEYLESLESTFLINVEINDNSELLIGLDS